MNGRNHQPDIRHGRAQRLRHGPTLTQSRWCGSRPSASVSRGVTAVDAVSLDIFQGEFFALLGPSGCGKTTLLRMLAGFETPDEGRVLLDGDDLSGVPPHRRPVNMMFQSYALFPHLTVEGNVAFGLKQDGLPKDEIAARVAEMLALVRLEGLEARKPHQLSGGQRQRVALARALVKRPRVLLLDEPLAALDKKLRGETQFELMHLKERLGLTFVIVTHDQEEAMTVADRIGVMNQGRLVQVATPPEIYEQPNSRWVADFIGDVNLIEGRVVEAGAAGNDGRRARRSARCARQRPMPSRATPSGSRCGRRRSPIARDAPPADEIASPARSPRSAISATSRSTRCGSTDGVVMKVAVANVTRVDRAADRVGDRVWLSWAADAGVVLTR